MSDDRMDQPTAHAAFEGTEPCDSCGEDNPATRGCPCGRRYCGHCECDCADWHLVIHEDHDGGYAACPMPDCVRLRAENTVRARESSVSGAKAADQ